MHVILGDRRRADCEYADECRSYVDVAPRSRTFLGGRNADHLSCLLRDGWVLAEPF
jgi:hypothetical protein